MKYSSVDFEASKFLGNAVGRTNPFMREIACMSSEYRELYGFLQVIEDIGKGELTPEDKTQLKMLKGAIQKLGQSGFTMDIVSHLSMKANVDESEFSVFKGRKKDV